MSTHVRSKRRRRILTAVATAALIGTASYWALASAAERGGAQPGTAAGRPSGPASWIGFQNNSLTYGHDAQGNRIPDFSYAGYEGGGKSLPTAEAVVTLDAQPGNGDDTARVQQALDTVAQRPLNAAGLRGAVLLRPGSYRLAGSLKISASGVVLRGSGSGPDGTQLVAAGSPHALITVAGTGQPAPAGSALAVTDDYVPVGATTLTLASTTGLTVGQSVIVQRPQEENWIAAIGMNHISPRSDGTPSTQWSPNRGLEFQRTITAIDGNRVTLDVPVTNALEKQYTHATVRPFSYPGRISQVGVEHLSADGIAFTQAPGYTGTGYFEAGLVSFDAVRDAWMSDVVGHRFGGGVLSVGTDASRITVADTAALDLDQAVPQSVHAQPGAYSVAGQQVLVTGCRVTGSNVHAWLTEALTAGPNVFTNCTSVNTGSRRLDAGPHQRWASGTLYDEITMQGSKSDLDDLALTDRGNAGSGQGWAGANQVLWNASLGYYAVQNPPTAHNWAFGTRGSAVGGQQSGVMVDTGSAMTPASLYAEQLRERLAAGH